MRCYDIFHRNKRRVYNDYPSRDVGTFNFDDNVNYDGKFNPLSAEGLKIHQENEWNYNDNDDVDDGFWYTRSVQPYYELVAPPRHLNNIFKTDNILNSAENMRKRFRPSFDGGNNGGPRRSFYFQ